MVGSSHVLCNVVSSSHVFCPVVGSSHVFYHSTITRITCRLTIPSASRELVRVLGSSNYAVLHEHTLFSRGNNETRYTGYGRSVK